MYLNTAFWCFLSSVKEMYAKSVNNTYNFFCSSVLKTIYCYVSRDYSLKLIKNFSRTLYIFDRKIAFRNIGRSLINEETYSTFSKEKLF